MGPRAGMDRRKISPPPGFNPRTVQPVVSRLYQLSYPANSNNMALPANRDDMTEYSQYRNMNHLNRRSEAINLHVKLRARTRKSRLSLRTTQRYMEAGEA